MLSYNYICALNNVAHVWYFAHQVVDVSPLLDDYLPM